MPPLRMPIALPQPCRISDLLRASQKAAGQHLDELGLHDAAPQAGLAWFIVRIRMDLHRDPTLAAEAETWPGATRKGMMPRYCVLRDGQGEELAYFQTVWALADLNTRQMLLESPIDVPDMSRGDEPSLPRSLGKKDLPLLGTFTPAANQIDKNVHMNNAAYPDAAEPFYLPLMKGRPLRSFAIDYRAEILPGTEISLYGSETEDGTIYLCGKSNEKEHFRMTLTCGA